MAGRYYIITAEHAGKEIPPAFAPLFKAHQELLRSHKGWDPGSLLLAKSLSRTLKAPLFTQKVSRLLIESNRSLWHPDLFSEVSSVLNAKQKTHVIEKIYNPHRNAIENQICRMTDKGHFVVHIAMHTFTPLWENNIRRTDIGLLFDPERNNEKELCHNWASQLASSLPGYQVDFNAPYAGIDDGLTTYLRTKFTDDQYAGIEIEVNQLHTAPSTSKIIASGLTRVIKKSNICLTPT